MKFHLGINYWPAAKAMYWWSRFDAGEVAADFKRTREAGFDSIRIFLLWEDFQPAPDRVSETALANLLQVADLAAENRLALIPTLFTGHMSGVNWLPAWALDTNETNAGSFRFRTISHGRVVNGNARNWYADPVIRKAQVLQSREVAHLLNKHPALWAYDLGNENSNCTIPPSRESAVAWLDLIAGAIRSVDSGHPITIGLHAEDLEEDRQLGPREGGRVCDFLCMHGYPMYLRWAGSPEDEQVLPFLGLITQWLGGKDVLFEEFGAPSADPVPDACEVAILSGRQSASYTRRALEALRTAGFLGAMIWCFADYDSSLWNQPPLDEAKHERFFGLWDQAGREKPAVSEVQRFAGQERVKASPDFDWIDIPPEKFYLAPAEHLNRLYRRFLQRYSQEATNFTMG